jgi:hypothetical protein
LDVEFLDKLQTVLEENGLNSEEGVAKLSKLGPSDPQYKTLVEQLERLGFTSAQAREQLTKWQAAQKELQKELQRVKEEAKTMVQTQEAIWRCAVCRRGGYPWIVCHVAPYVECFRPVQIPE